jgi:hypothetical protein
MRSVAISNFDIYIRERVIPEKHWALLSWLRARRLLLLVPYEAAAEAPASPN